MKTRCDGCIYYAKMKQTNSVDTISTVCFPIKLYLPFPPSVNHYWQRNRNGGMRISNAGIVFRDDVASAILAHKSRSKRILTAITGAVRVDVWIYPPDKRRRDIDNILKALLDALAHAGIYEDDSQITELHVFKEGKQKYGETVAHIYSLEDKSCDIER